jgi:hypothetical protein
MIWISLILTVPTVLYSSMVQQWSHYTAPAFTGHTFVAPLFGSSARDRRFAGLLSGPSEVGHLLVVVWEFGNDSLASMGRAARDDRTRRSAVRRQC